MPSGLQSDGQWLCKPCDRIFASCEALLDHKQQMRQAGRPKHIHCKHCGQDFKTEGAEIFHIQAFHPQEQNLTCVACGQGPFVRVGGLIAHIEQGQCVGLDASVIDERREKKTEFSRKLEVLTGEPIKNSFAKYIYPLPVRGAIHVDSSVRRTSLPSEASRSVHGVLEPRSVNVPTKIPGSEGVTDWFISLDSANRARNGGVKPAPGGGAVDPVVETENTLCSGSDFAPVSIKEEPIEWHFRSAPSPVANTDVEKNKATESVADWRGIKNELPPSCPAWQRPSVEKTGQAQEGSMLGLQIFDSVDQDHPDYPSFNSARYHCPYAERFICPKLPCGKAFKTAGGLISHLRSTAHGNRTYQCPYCLRKFKSLAAIVSHAEQSNVHCRIRESDNYDAFIHQLTAGIVDVDMKRHDDGTIKYETRDDW
ncbi:palmitoyltransferase PFA3 [Hirsutella rhossiliensis]|uniref:Palmitoyltransferase PFA3 n=1 Tax=Hirsutella rhossiliensis TaxID=111463 RepID=A0A9P8SN30_9HYPO|nr:palmitoyltransferase PFA3 [Hirsutella rhossiliensis]KAH0967939.1 palmitoyltransferase PFA3 [Hirsutella rhossiliensis]